MEQNRPDLCPKLLLTTSTSPPAEDCQVLGIVSGASVMSRNIVMDLGAAIKNTTGGELKTYTSLVTKAFDQALERLAERAIALGADGVFGVQMACPQVCSGAADVLLMGTAYRRGKGGDSGS